MHCAEYSEPIHALVDGALGAIRRAELQRHLETCEACAAFARDLQAIRDAAAGLEPVEPPARVWLQLAGRLRQEGLTAAPSPKSRHYGVMAAIAASILLAVGVSLGLWLPRLRAPAAPASGAATSAPQGGGNASADATVEGVEAEFRLAEQHYQNAIAKLEQAARIGQTDDAARGGGQSDMDPQTAAMLQRNLQVIDAAIAESRTAVRQQPQSAAARDSLFDALRQKVALLQDTIALMNEMRKGNAAGAAQILQDASKS